MLEQVFAEAFGIALFLTFLFFLFIWALIRSAVKSGTKAALNEFYTETLHADETKAQREQELKEEMDGWN